MSIQVHNSLFSLCTRDSLYQMKVDQYGVLNHTWYGPDTAMDMSYIEDYPEISFSANLWDTEKSRMYSTTVCLNTRAAGFRIFAIPRFC